MFDLPKYTPTSFADLQKGALATASGTSFPSLSSLSTPISNSSASTTSSASGSSSGGFGAGIGNIFSKGLEAASSFGQGLLQLELFKSASKTNAEVQNLQTQQAIANAQTAATVGDVHRQNSSSNMVKYAAYAGAGLLTLLIIMMLVKD